MKGPDHENCCEITGTVRCDVDRRVEEALVGLSPLAAEAWALFAACESQWRTDWGYPTGLDYAAVLALASSPAFEVEMTPEVFALVQLLEAERLKRAAADAKKRSDAGKSDSGKNPRGVIGG